MTIFHCQKTCLFADNQLDKKALNPLGTPLLYVSLGYENAVYYRRRGQHQISATFLQEVH